MVSFPAPPFTVSVPVNKESIETRWNVSSPPRRLIVSVVIEPAPFTTWTPSPDVEVIWNEPSFAVPVSVTVIVSALSVPEYWRVAPVVVSPIGSSPVYVITLLSRDTVPEVGPVVVKARLEYVPPSRTSVRSRPARRRRFRKESRRW